MEVVYHVPFFLFPTKKSFGASSVNSLKYLYISVFSSYVTKVETMLIDKPILYLVIDIV